MVYLDNAATTTMYPVVVKTISATSHNPSAFYKSGQIAKKRLQLCKETLSGFINAEPEEIYFTSGGTESNNWALKGIAEQLGYVGKHIITSKIEHPSVLETCRYLEEKGFEITYINVDQNGIVDVDELEEAIRDDTILVSVMMVNNEIGTIQPIREIGNICCNRGVLFHVDAVQAFGKLSIDVEDMNIDMLSVSAHKFNGPKGVGFLYIKKGTILQPLLHGGHQQDGMRAGTENVEGIHGMTVAAEIHYGDMERNNEHIKYLFNFFYEKLQKQIPGIHLNGSAVNRWMGNINISIDGVRSEQLLMLLNESDIYVSAGSACSTGSGKPSHVLKAIGLSDEEASSSIRITFDEELLLEKIDTAVDAMKRYIDILRR